MAAVRRVLGIGAMLTLALAQATAAQSLTGLVADEAGRPLAEAHVVVLPGVRTATTDASGRFRVQHLAAGEYRVQVSLIGYAPVTRTLRLGAGAVESLELRLTRTPLTLSGIEVTASGLGRDPSAVPSW